MENFLFCGGWERSVLQTIMNVLKGKIPVLKKKNLMTHFKCYQQSEMTGNTRWANSRHSMC